ncbi:19631_t:CDS:2, partial [Gigaspora margarita]
MASDNNPYIPLDDTLTTVMIGIIPGLFFPSLGIGIVFSDTDQNSLYISFNHDVISQFCVEHYDKFFPGRCRLVNLLSYSAHMLFIVIYFGSVISLFPLVFYRFRKKLRQKKQLEGLIRFCKKFKPFYIVIKHLNRLFILLLVIFPAIKTGYLLSTNSITTRLSFGICSISVSRILEHYNDDQPEKINTLVSFYMNYDLNMCMGDIIRSKTKKILKDLLKILTLIEDRVEFKTAKKINYVKNSVEKQLELFREKSKDIENLSKIQESIKNVIFTLKCQMKKLENDAKKPIKALKYLRKIKHVSEKNKANDKFNGEENKASDEDNEDNED